jgi:hypothetical protein
MPVKDLIQSLSPAVPDPVRQAASGLCYRSFVIVGLLLKKLLLRNTSRLRTLNGLVPDQWIYVQ